MLPKGGGGSRQPFFKVINIFNRGWYKPSSRSNWTRVIPTSISEVSRGGRNPNLPLDLPNPPLDLPMIIGSDRQIFQRTIVNIFLPINFYICFGCSKEPSLLFHRRRNISETIQITYVSHVNLLFIMIISI